MLEGRLNEFRLGDVFQLLAWTKKSGALTVEAGPRRGRVDFSGGQVAFAVADVRRAELGARLANAGIVSDEALARVVEAQQSGLGTIAEVLLDEGLAEAAVEDLLREHVQDAVFTLLRTADGGFTFEPGDAPEGPSVPRLDTESLIAEGARRLEEWEEVRQRIPSPDAVLAMTPNPPAEDGSVTVSADQWRLLALVDGARSVTELVDLTGQGEFAASQVLAELVEAGLLDAVDPADGDTGLGELLARRASLRALEESQLGMPSEAAQLEGAPAAEPAPELALVSELSVEPRPAFDPQPEPELAPEAWFAEEPAPAYGAEHEPPAAVEEPAPASGAAAEPSAFAEETPPAADAGWGFQPRTEGVPEWEPAVEASPEAAPVLEASPEVASAQPARELAEELFNGSNGGTPAWEAAPEQVDELPVAGDGAQAVGSSDQPATPPAALPDEPSGPVPAPQPAVDRVQVARELASLGFEGPPAAPAPTTDESHRRLTRDEDVTRGLLVRLMDGVRKA